MGGNADPALLPALFLILLNRAGVEPLKAMRTVGHSEYQTTAVIYTLLDQERQNVHLINGRLKPDELLVKAAETVSEFDDVLWGSLVEYVTVGKDKMMVFSLIGGTKIEA